MNNLQNEIFKDEAKAREWLEQRVWPNGPVCPHCSDAENHTALQGEAHRLPDSTSVTLAGSSSQLP